MLTTEFQYFLDHQTRLVDEYSGKYLVIVGEEVVGAYDSFQEAYPVSYTHLTLPTTPYV